VRQAEIDVFKVILPGTFDNEILFGHLNILTPYNLSQEDPGHKSVANKNYSSLRKETSGHH
jgi:hypothetical protein